MLNEPRSSYALIDGVEISELDLLRYEAKRARLAHFLLYEKIRALGVASLLKGEIAAMQRIEDEWVKRSHGQWTGSITEIRVNGGSAGGFLKWLQGRMASDDAVMANAHPEHYAVVREPDDRVSVLETSGGWKVPSFIYTRFTQDDRECRRTARPGLARSDDRPSGVRTWRGTGTGAAPVWGYLLRFLWEAGDLLAGRGRA